jgi:hypothetical protein
LVITLTLVCGKSRFHDRQALISLIVEHDDMHKNENTLINIDNMVLLEMSFLF